MYVSRQDRSTYHRKSPGTRLPEVSIQRLMLVELPTMRKVGEHFGESNYRDDLQFQKKCHTGDHRYTSRLDMWAHS